MTRARSRVIGFTLALLVQAAFVANLIWSAPRFIRSLPHVGELTLLLPRLPPDLPPDKAQPAHPATSAPYRLPAVAPTQPLPAPPDRPPTSAIQGFGRALNGCAPETYANLPLEQRAPCARLGDGMAMARTPDLMGAPSHVKNEARWQGELARAHSPALLPCLGGLDVMCLLLKMADGSLSDFGDPKTWPIYETRQLASEDFYKIEQAYAEWHNAHPGKTEPASDNADGVSR